jgi:hypothetical protein
VSPSEFKTSGSGQAVFNINFYNTYGDVDAYYTLKADECINPYVTSGFNSDILVPKGTTITNSVSYQFVLNGNFTQQKTCYVYVYGRPVGIESQEGNVAIQRRIGVRMILGSGELKPNPTTTTTISGTTTTVHQNNPTTTTIQSGGNNGVSGSTTTTTRTTTTSTTTTFIQTLALPPDQQQYQQRVINSNPTTTQQEQSQQEQQQTTEQPKKGLANFFLNTTAGFFTLIGIIVVSILVVIFFIQRGKNKSQYNPLLQDNQGVHFGG